MRAAEAMVLWNPGTSEVDVLRRHDFRNRKYKYSDGACWSYWSGLKPIHRDLLLMVMFNTLVVRDGIPVEAAHRAFLKIREYRQRISPDIDGAEDDLAADTRPKQKKMFDERQQPHGRDLSQYDFKGGPF